MEAGPVRQAAAPALSRSPSRAVVPGAMLLLALLMAAATPAHAASCPGADREVALTFRSVFDRARLDHTKPAATIDAMFTRMRKDASIARRGSAVGLTVTQSEFRFSTQIQYYKRSDGRFCVYLRSVDAHLNLRDTVIYVAREYPRGSCNFDVIYEHEKQHMRIHYRVLKAYAPRVKRTLQALIQHLNPRVVRTLDEARNEHAEVINNGVADLIESMESDRMRFNAALDTPENYARERDKCPSW
ncbi:hypothetical protein [Roseospira visakhapatnamensis]|uniref:Putative secreted Zn-dependent protease n=1 Tax=Roseospira visakhapatnamensis TaxID=390880 RepID=A0A7W6RA27_9PROT|nr:hypothetical protein [Roseospira visakhapatnamensis]MBB4264730.1 putative secreted Zn-dependent protease [Roseospira visakhapatnamensis]